ALPGSSGVRRGRGARARGLALGRAGGGAGMTSDAIARPAPHAKPNGWWGMAAFVTTEATLFGVLFGTYIYLRFRAVRWPPPGSPDPKAALPLVLAVVLAATIVPMALAARAAQRGLARRASLLILVALVVQCAYFGVALHEFSHDLDRFTPQSGAY